MTPQQIIPGKKYSNLGNPQTKYEGRGTVNPETLDCEDKHIVVVEYSDGFCPVNGDEVRSPEEAMPGFWDNFFSINA